MTQLPSSSLIGLIRLRRDLSPPLLGRSCRFTPRCSAGTLTFSEGIVRTNNSSGQGYKGLQSALWRCAMQRVTAVQPPTVFSIP